MQVPVQPKPTITKAKTRIGNLGHLTRIANRMIQASASNSTIQIHLQVYSLYQHLNQFQVTIHVTITGEPNIHLPKPRNPDIPWLSCVKIKVVARGCLWNLHADMTSQVVTDLTEFSISNRLMDCVV
jgi:hypothetical protein